MYPQPPTTEGPSFLDGPEGDLYPSVPISAPPPARTLLGRLWGTDRSLIGVFLRVAMIAMIALVIVQAAIWTIHVLGWR